MQFYIEACPVNEFERIRVVWQTIPALLFRENKKFIYGAVAKGACAKDFEMATQWLYDAGFSPSSARLLCKNLLTFKELRSFISLFLNKTMNNLNTLNIQGELAKWNNDNNMLKNL